NKSRASPALQSKHLRSTETKLAFSFCKTSTTVFCHLLTKARANSAKPLRLLLRVPLAFQPFG
ncbi:TPA: hypothetical protein ACW30R_004853, partial [Salmonella enterica]